ncbi:MAG: DUF4127 family protein [Mycobacterium leprae]
MRRWLFLPNDDRPTTCQFPVLMAPMGDIELVVPPRALMGRYQQAGDPAALVGWAKQNAAGCEGAIVSLELLSFGGSCASRKPLAGVAEVLPHLELLTWLKQQGLTILACNMLMRISPYGGTPEESARHALLHQWAQAVENADRQAEVAELERAIPPIFLKEYLDLRERNLRVTLEAIRLVSRDVIEFLLLLQEESLPHGIHRLELQRIHKWVEANGASSRVRIMPGTDQGSMLLLARAAVAAAGTTPRLRPVYGREASANLTPPFEDRPLRETVDLHIEAAGAQRVEQGDDVTLFVNTPVYRYGDEAEVNAVERATIAPAVTDGSRPLVTQIRASLQSGHPTAVADVAFANGADPLFTQHLLRETDWTRLWGYAAWNTAANTLGIAVAMAILRQLDGGRHDQLQQEALLRRMLEDHAYQGRLRSRLNDWCFAHGHSPLYLGDACPAAEAQVMTPLRHSAEFLVEVGAGRHGYKLQRFAARLPWPRTFEVEIDLQLSR